MTLTHSTRARFYPYSVHTRDHFFTDNQMYAHDRYAKRGRNYTRHAPRQGKDGSVLVVPVLTKNEDAFYELVAGLTAKLLRGATSHYVNGLQPVYWRGLGTVASTGYDAVELRNAVETAANNQLRAFGYCTKVSLKLHPTQERLVLQLKIVKLTPR